MNNTEDDEESTYEQDISGKYMDYKRNQYTNDLRCTLLDDLQGITPVITICISAHVDLCLRTLYDGGR
jgi:hypothetical protein